MANSEHLKILNQSVRAWNSWTRKNPEIQRDLSWSDLSGTDLSGVQLGGVNLNGANLNGANLCGANLCGANLISAYLSGTNLVNANLGGADLGAAQLSGADLRGAQLSGVLLGGADLSWADLSGAQLSGVNLFGVDLFGANLVGANLLSTTLCCASLLHANLSRAQLSGADLSEAMVGWTIFSDIDLSEATGLETVRHQGPSTIGIDTLYESGGKINEFFLRGCGVPDEFISYIPSHIGARQAIQFYSCFISHSVKDKRFCERLYADLQAKNVRVWYFPEDAKWGEPVWGEIDQSIKIYDKLVVVCSKNSLQSGPVRREIQRALSREDREGRNVLFPIRIDDYIFKTWEHERKADVLNKVVGNFTGWSRSAAKYEDAFEKLLRALQAVDSKV